MENEDLIRKINTLEQELNLLKIKMANHQHDQHDGTSILRKSITLDGDQFLQIGNGGMASAPVSNLGTTSEQYQFSIATGRDDGRTGFVNKADILQLNLQHYPNNASNQSFITAFTYPLVTPTSETISVTAGQNKVTINGLNFTTNELAGALIDISNSSGALVETQTIASNTATEITISGTWGASTSGGSFYIYQPVFLGSANTIWQRFYTQEGEAGGIRFGVGPTAGGQNGLLYMDATGNLYWRPKTGAAVKLN
jgi:hypothetical protein